MSQVTREWQYMYLVIELDCVLVEIFAALHNSSCTLYTCTS